MIITSGLILPKELRINKDDLRDIIIEVFYHNKNFRLKGLDSDVVFIAVEGNEEIVREVEQWTGG
jgi:hypothetical protein